MLSRTAERYLVWPAGEKALPQYELMRWRFTDGNINSSACCDHRDFALLQISRGSATQANHKDGGKDNQPQHNFLGVALDVQEIHKRIARSMALPQRSSGR
jgi:hypothetical protein